MMADAAAVGEGNTVLEVGPGTGVLTRELLARGAHIVAVETDQRALTVLRETFKVEIEAKQLTLIDADMRNAHPRDFGLREHAYKVVANIPYYLSGKLFRTFLETDTQPSILVFLVQKEVATRIVRDPKESLLSLSVKAYGTPRYVTTVSRNDFTPPPKIDSAIIAVTDISHDHFIDLDESYFFELLHAGFASRRKQLLGNLIKKVKRSVLVDIFSTCNLPLDVRGEDLSVKMWLSLVREVAIHR